MKIGFIGGGNMGRAMIKTAVLNFGAQNVFACARSKNDILANEFGITVFKDENELINSVDVAILAIKPNAYENVLNKIKSSIKEQIIIIIAPNFTILQAKQILGKNSKIARAMPNTPACIAQGVSAICYDENLSKNEQAKVKGIFQSFGRIYELEESKFGAFTAIAGSLPAYIFMLIEAVGDGGVLNGISRDLAYEIIAQSVAGSVNLMLETKKHPAILKDEICSPSGTTIQAVKILENGKFRATLIEAVNACAKKANEKN